MKVALVLVVCAANLSGCASPGVVASNERSVIVRAGRPFLPPIGSAEAQQMADAQCRQHRRVAQMAGRPDANKNEYVFYCVEP